MYDALSGMKSDTRFLFSLVRERVILGRKAGSDEMFQM
jgi:hypothetical protein